MKRKVIIGFRAAVAPSGRYYILSFPSNCGVNMAKENNTGLIVGIIVVVVIIAAALYFVIGNSGTVPQTSTVQTTAPSTTEVSVSASTTVMNSNAVLFSNSSYYQYACQIYPAVALSSTCQTVTSDFTTSTSQGANVTAVSIVFTETRTTYSASVAAGSKLYWIDENPSDDAGISGDHYPGDDGYTVVNSTGYMTSVAFPIPGT